MNRALFCFIGLVVIAGCSRHDNDVRRIVQEELSASHVKTYHTPTKVIGPYTPAVQVGPLLFVSGQIALDPVTGQMVQTNIETETRQVLSNLRQVLGSAGYDSSQVVSATVYLKNMNDYQRMNAVYATFFAEGRYPARVAVEVSNLPKAANVEIAVIASR